MKRKILLQHVDQFQNNNRKYSMISYLNSDWQPADGGELMIHQENRNQKLRPRKERLFF
jgi:SM-20-related protein